MIVAPSAAQQARVISNGGGRTGRRPISSMKNSSSVEVPRRTGMAVFPSNRRREVRGRLSAGHQSLASTWRPREATVLVPSSSGHS